MVRKPLPETAFVTASSRLRSHLNLCLSWFGKKVALKLAPLRGLDSAQHLWQNSKESRRGTGGLCHICQKRVEPQEEGAEDTAQELVRPSSISRSLSSKVRISCSLVLLHLSGHTSNAKLNAKMDRIQMVGGGTHHPQEIVRAGRKVWKQSPGPRPAVANG